MGTTTRFIRKPNWMLICVIAYITLIIVYVNVNWIMYQRHSVLGHKVSIEGNKTSPRAATNMKYILMWWYGLKQILNYQEGQDIFIKNNCKHSNCYLTFNSKYLKDPSHFDAVVFSGYSTRLMNGRPYNRSIKQKYVFAMPEPPSICPVVHPLFDDFFNWTWTYRLDSDITWRYITIYDLKGNVVGPAVNMKWPKDLKPIEAELKNKLKYKSKAVAWFVSHCATQSQREHFVDEFKVELQKYGFSVDSFGLCGELKCNRTASCYKILEKDYYFYLSFENTIDVDYVTEKVLNALNNFVVPVVYGGANYTRFLPPGSYLNARELGPKSLAKVMNDVIRNITFYYEFFRWRNHFRYDLSETSSEMCNICTALNDEKKMKTSIVTNFRDWWNTRTRQRTYEFLLETFLFDNNLQNLAQKYNFTRASSLVLWEHIRNQSDSFKESKLNEYIGKLDLLSLSNGKPSSPKVNKY